MNQLDQGLGRPDLPDRPSGPVEFAGGALTGNYSERCPYWFYLYWG
jgi:hypothetical protein